MAGFERQFSYPLGASASFRISHGESYLPFFQAQGWATVLVAEMEGRVVGTVAVVLRSARLPSGKSQPIAYLADLKVSPAARRGLVLFLLLAAARELIAGEQVTAACAIVMDGTARTPVAYTGRLGIPSFGPVAAISVWKLLATGSQPPQEMEETSASVVAETQSALVSPGFLFQGGDSALRSEMPAHPLLLKNHRACGVVEDTRLGKRLFQDNGEEMRAAHLSRFAFKSAADGAALLRAALSEAVAAGHPALFAAFPARYEAEFSTVLPDIPCHRARATIFATGLAEPGDWWVDTAEI